MEKIKMESIHRLRWPGKDAPRSRFDFGQEKGRFLSLRDFLFLPLVSSFSAFQN